MQHRGQKPHMFLTHHWASSQAVVMTKSHVEMTQSTETLKKPHYGCVLDKLEDNSMENMLDEICSWWLKFRRQSGRSSRVCCHERILIELTDVGCCQVHHEGLSWFPATSINFDSTKRYHGTYSARDSLQHGQQQIFVFRGNSIGGVRKKRTPFLLLQHAWPPTLLTPVTLSKRIQHCRSIVLSQLQMGPQNNLKINLMCCQLIKEHGRSEPYPPPCHSPHTPFPLKFPTTPITVVTTFHSLSNPMLLEQQMYSSSFLSHILTGKDLTMWFISIIYLSMITTVFDCMPCSQQTFWRYSGSTTYSKERSSTHLRPKSLAFANGQPWI